VAGSMTARRDLATTVYQADRAIDQLHKPLVPKIGASVRTHAVDGRITQDARRSILRDVDVLLDTVYGERRNGPSALRTVILNRANAARALVIADAVEQMRRVTPDDVLRAMGDEI
jgi:hypothetical protein